MNKPTLPFHPATNPRFVWNIGSLREEYPDLPEQGEMIDLIDRLTGRPVVSIHPRYGQAFVLESNKVENGAPFTSMETWFNSLTPEELESENLPTE